MHLATTRSHGVGSPAAWEAKQLLTLVGFPVCAGKHWIDVSEPAANVLRIEISPAPEGTPVLVALAGEMDIVSSRTFADTISELEQSAPDRIVVDLSGLTFVDSSGINALLQAARTVEARGGSLVLAAPGRHVRHVFEIARVADVVPVIEEPAEALRPPEPPVAVKPDAPAEER